MWNPISNLSTELGKKLRQSNKWKMYLENNLCFFSLKTKQNRSLRAVCPNAGVPILKILELFHLLQVKYKYIKYVYVWEITEPSYEMIDFTTRLPICHFLSWQPILLSFIFLLELKFEGYEKSPTEKSPNLKSLPFQIALPKLPTLPNRLLRYHLPDTMIFRLMQVCQFQFA